MQEFVVDIQKWFSFQLIINIVVAIVIILIAWAISKVMNRALMRMFSKYKIDLTVGKFVARSVSALVVLLGVLMAISRLGVPTASLITVVGAAGVAIAFALRNSLSNVAAGIILALIRPIRVGNFIDVGGKAGTVDEVGLLYTYLNTKDNKRIVIPNNQLMSSAIINFSQFPTRRTELIIGIGYDDDINKAIKTIDRAIRKDKRVLSEPSEPMIAVKELSDSSVDLVIRYWTVRADLEATKFSLNQSIKEALDKAGISIPFPQRDINIKNSAQ